MSTKPKQPKELTVEQRVGNLERLLKWLLGASGLTLVGLLIFAFWLGSVSTKISNSTERIDKVYGAVLENKDSLQSRTSVIETKLNIMDGKLDDLVKLRERTSVTARPMPEPTPTP